jgi:serine/threonine protein kinase
VRLLDFFEDANTFYLIFEWLDFTYLDFVTQNPNLKERQIKAIMYQIFQALQYMHEELNIAHRDVKLENIMIKKDPVTSSLVAKLIDFGLSKFFTPDEFCMRPTGTLAYCSPEIVLSRAHNKSTDIWSAGIMLYASFARRMPFITPDKKETVMNIVREPVQFLTPASVWLGRRSSQQDLTYKGTNN